MQSRHDFQARRKAKMVSQLICNWTSRGAIGAAAVAAATLMAWAPLADARVTRIVVDTVTPVTGQTPVPAGYEELTGRAFGELDSNDPHNTLITDIGLVSGKAQYIASFRIRRPTDMSLASGVIWHDVP